LTSQSYPAQFVGVLLLACASLVACGGARAPVNAARPETPGAHPVPARPLGEQSPQLLAAWHRTDAEWASWTDLSSKHVRFITVPGRAREKVRLEVLDWGGQGPALVLLAGLGESGHIYNDLAPRLTDRFRVVAITRRGHGASSHADTSTYVFDTLVADIGAVMDSLQLKRASLIGHSIAGTEITRFTVRFPGRVDKLVYLDASHDFAGIDSILGANPAWPPDFKPPLGTRTDTLNAARNWSKHYRFGYWSDALESGILRSPDSDPAADRCLLRDAILHPKEYRAVRAPALAVTARYTMENWFFYLDPVADSVKWRESKHWLTMVVQPWLDAGHERFRREMRTHQTIEFETDHHLFNSHPDRTLREIRRFLLSPAAP
jgi:pimeloyl-ACP methyl ester carboxylesterase